METGSSIAVESAYTVAMEPAAVRAANVSTAVSVTIPIVAIIATVSIVTAVSMSIVTTVSPIPAVSVSMEPGSSADEHAAYEPARPVEAVRSACVRVIIVVPIRANWSRAIIPAIHRPNSNSH
jgi:hypothetical protein